MADFMGQHRHDLAVAHLPDERIEQHDTLDLADAGEIGVGVFAAPGGIICITRPTLRPAFSIITRISASRPSSVTGSNVLKSGSIT